VDLETVPLKVDPGASDEPFAAILKVNCADTKFRLENYNYPQKATIKWAPSQCGDTSLSIEFSNFTLHREYKGNLGFAKFLAEFKDGSRTFAADDFPEWAQHLKQAGITGIGITYKISGAKAIVDLLGREPAQVPEKITICRDGR
jgi:type VI secretion system protein ImpL